MLMKSHSVQLHGSNVYLCNVRHSRVSYGIAVKVQGKEFQVL